MSLLPATIENALYVVTYGHEGGRSYGNPCDVGLPPTDTVDKEQKSHERPS
jgi:hypothetical protein